MTATQFGSNQLSELESVYRWSRSEKSSACEVGIKVIATNNYVIL